MGDFNYGVRNWPVLHYDSQITDDTKCFIDAIENNFFTQHVHTPTRQDNILDMVITGHPDLVVAEMENL